MPLLAHLALCTPPWAPPPGCGCAAGSTRALCGRGAPLDRRPGDPAGASAPRGGGAGDTVHRMHSTVELCAPQPRRTIQAWVGRGTTQATKTDGSSALQSAALPLHESYRAGCALRTCRAASSADISSRLPPARIAPDGRRGNRTPATSCSSKRPNATRTLRVAQGVNSGPGPAVSSNG